MHKSQSLFYLTEEINSVTCASSWKSLFYLTDKINSVTCASNWNYILEYYYDARTHEH